MKRNLLIFTALFSVLFLLCASVTTFADDGKVYPGSMGVRWSSYDPVPTLNASAIGNPSSTKSLRVDLPVIHDCIGNNIEQGWVKVIDMHYGQNIRCSLNSVYRNGSSFYGWWGPNKYSSGSSQNPKTLTHGGLGSNTQAHYYYSCSIPPTYNGNRSYIISYYVEEND